ncbi:MAG: hypothetical protein ACK44D_14160, partial [Bacteroidia bacterium]
MHTEVISTIKNSKVGSESPAKNFFIKNFPWLAIILLPFFKISSAIKISAVICLFVLSTFLKPLYAIPQDGVVAEGSATISQTGTYTQITQTSDRAIINWQSFNIANGEHVHFQQP